MNPKDDLKKENELSGTTPELPGESIEKNSTQQEVEEFRGKYLRVYADFDNARKRWEKEREELLRFGELGLLKDFLGALDEIDHALTAAKAHKNSDEIAKGLEILRNNFLGIFKKRGVVPIETKGKIFDPYVHEIAGSIPIVDGQEHEVIQEIQRGYMLDDRVLRTAKVIIGIKKPEENINKEVNSELIDQQEQGEKTNRENNE
jgi:molecular chaperone GrpE